ncbi:MAG: acyl-CoA thioesterase [Planctomycetes bacterium]|nr:acyl-CoA thioesterase [Planctomycetota bacterium]
MSQSRVISDQIDMAERSNPFDLSPYSIAHDKPFLCDLTVDDQAVSEMIPHVINTEYVRWLDKAAELHSDSLGYSRQGMLDDGFMWFVVRHEIDYLAEAWPGDDLVVITWVRDMQRVKSWREYVVVRPNDEAIICKAATLWVLVDLNSRKPKRISLEMAEQFSPLEITKVKR